MPLRIAWSWRSAADCGLRIVPALSVTHTAQTFRVLERLRVNLLRVLTPSEKERRELTPDSP
jgi:hypothetical protein